MDEQQMTTILATLEIKPQQGKEAIEALLPFLPEFVAMQRESEYWDSGDINALDILVSMLMTCVPDKSRNTIIEIGINLAATRYGNRPD